MRQEKINYAECCEKYASTDEKALINGFGKKFDPLPMDEKKGRKGPSADFGYCLFPDSTRYSTFSNDDHADDNKQYAHYPK